LPSSSGGDELAEPQSSASGTSELLDPHLPSLSKFWLAALKDKACLFLPLELQDQLPQPRRGMFYSIDVMDEVKQYYEANWSSLLLAAAIWLQERGFVKDGEEKDESAELGVTPASLPVPLLPDSASSVPATSTSDSPKPSTTSNPRQDKFHLLLGLAVQSLCTPATLDQTHVLSNCLRTLRELLGSTVAQEVLTSDCRVGMELLGVMHRLLLTCSSFSIHTTAMQVAGMIGDILVKAASSFKTSEDTSSALESKDDAEVSKDDRIRPEASIEPGKSCAYAVLQVAACSLLRLVPSLRNSSPLGSQHTLLSSQPPKSEELIVILHSVRVLDGVIGMCDPEGTLAVLPPVLHLLLSTLAYMCALEKSTNLATVVSEITASGMQSLGQICAVLPLSDAQVGEQLTTIVQSALVSVLGKHAAHVPGAKEEAELAKIDDGTRLLIAAVLLLRTSEDICPAPSNLFDGCILLFKHCLSSSDVKVWLL